MDYDDWKTETSRGILTPRSSLLKELDSKFKDYSKTPGTKTLIPFSNAVLAWIASKGDDWKKSERNTLKKNGKGTVERLVDDLSKNPTVGGRFAKLVTAVAATNQPIDVENGRVMIQKDDDGGFFELRVQARENSCGPACLRIVAKLVQNADIGEDYLRQLVERAEEGSGYSGDLGQGGVIASSGDHDWDPTGGGTWLVPEGLAGLRPSIRARHSTSTAELMHTTKSKPAIAVVRWDGGGGLHYVVVAGKYKGDPNTMRVIDPFYGVQTVAIASGILGKYKPRNPVTKAMATEGTWYPWVCKVT